MKQFTEQGISYLISESSLSWNQSDIIKFINDKSNMEEMTLPLPEFGCIVSLDKTDHPIIGYAGGHHAYAKKFFIDIFVITPHLRSINIGSNLMTHFLKYIKGLGFNHIFAMTQSSSTEMIKWLSTRDIPIKSCYELDISLDILISKFEA